jgi:hypothetical protein
MSVLAWSVKDNITDLYSWLNELKLFAVAQGWTAPKHEQNKEWIWTGSQYDFVANSEHFLELTSSGYGSQTLHFRFRCQATGSDPDAEFVDLSGFDGDDTGLDHASAVHPVLRDGAGHTRFHTQGRISLPTATIPRTWFFGNDKFILAVQKVDSTFVNMMCFGSLELFNTSGETEGFFMGSPQIGAFQTWYSHLEVCPLDLAQLGTIFYNGGGVSTANYGYNFVMSPAGNSHINGRFASYGRIVRENSFSSVRPIVKQIIYFKDTDLLWLPLGTIWIYRVYNKNLLMGEIVEMGAKKYVTFPNGRQNERYTGIAVQIA